VWKRSPFAEPKKRLGGPPPSGNGLRGPYAAPFFRRGRFRALERRGRGWRLSCLFVWKRCRRRTGKGFRKKECACKAKAESPALRRERNIFRDRRGRNPLSRQVRWDNWCSAGRGDYIFRGKRRKSGRSRRGGEMFRRILSRRVPSLVLAADLRGRHDWRGLSCFHKRFRVGYGCAWQDSVTEIQNMA